jgi:lysophospholipase L1-like esterase
LGFHGFAASASIPRKATIAVLGGHEATALTAATGATRMLQREVGKGPDKRSWRFKPFAVRGGRVTDILAEAEQWLERNDPEAVLLQVGFGDAWDSRAETGPTTPLDEYRDRLTALIELSTAQGLPVILGTPLLAGELPSGGNPADSHLDAVAAINRELAAAHGLPLFDGRKTLTDWLASNNDRQRKSGLLTVNGTKLRRGGHQLLLPALGAPISGTNGSTNTRSSKASSGGLALPNKPHTTIMTLGDRFFVAGMSSGVKDRTRSWNLIVEEAATAAQPDQQITWYTRSKNSGGELFENPGKLVEQVDTQITALGSVHTVVMGYGFNQASKGITAFDDELADLGKAIAQLRSQGIAVGLVAPYRMYDDERTLTAAKDLTRQLSALASTHGATLIPTVDIEQRLRAEGKKTKGMQHSIIGEAICRAFGIHAE